MDDLEVLRERIPSYAGYVTPGSRHDSDKQVRAYLGEALSEARERIVPPPDLADRIDGLILRCEFTDQAFVRASDRARFDADLAARVHGFDRAVVACADRIRSANGVDELSACAGDAETIFDRRAAVVEARR